jgi:hypothetical protein
MMLEIVLFLILPLCSGPMDSHRLDSNRLDSRQDRISWRTGRDLDSQLAKLISITLSGAPLRVELQRFATQQKIGLFVDRRVDPGTPVELVARDQTFEQILWQVADQNQLGVCRLGDFFYLGPLHTADHLPLIWQQMKQQSSQLRSQARGDSSVDWTSRQPLDWDLLSIPGQLLEALSRQHRFTIEPHPEISPTAAIGPLPHDLWPAISLPDLSLDGQVGLLLVGFGLWYERDSASSQIRLVSFPSLEQGRYEFAAGENGRQRLNELKRQFPDCQFAQSGTSLRVSGSPQQLREVRRWLSQANRPAGQGAGRQVFSLTIKASRGSILNSVAVQTGRQFKFEHASAEPLAEFVELSVQEIELEGLIQEVIKGTGLKYQLDDRQLIVR